MTEFKFDGGYITVNDLDNVIRMSLSQASGVPKKYFVPTSSSAAAAIEARGTWIVKLTNAQAFYWLCLALRCMTYQQMLEFLYPQARQYRNN